MALSLDLKVAIIGSTAAVIGTLAGGGVTWWQTRDLQNRQFAREDHVRVVVAAAAAAVDGDRFDVARSAVQTMRHTRRYFDIADDLKPRLSVSDVQSVVGQLDSRDRAARNQADLCVAHLATVVRGHGIGRERIPPYVLPSLDADGACAAAGAKALQGLAARVRTS
jgi:hypothetical protein